MGGMGVLSHRECAAHARAAAMESADATLAPILGEGWNDDALTFVSQGERCKVMLEARRDKLISSFGDLERKAMVENRSVLGLKWLTAIPFNDTSRLTDFEVQVGLHYRTLVPAAMACRYCGHSDLLGRDEVCLSSQRSRWTIMRHNGIVNAFADAVKSVTGTRVQVEPITTDHNLVTAQRPACLGLGCSGHCDHRTRRQGLLATRWRVAQDYRFGTPWQDGSSRCQPQGLGLCPRSVQPVLGRCGTRCNEARSWWHGQVHTARVLSWWSGRGRDDEAVG